MMFDPVAYREKLEKRFWAKVGPPVYRCVGLKMPCREWKGTMHKAGGFGVIGILRQFKYGDIKNGKTIIPVRQLVIYLKTGMWPNGNVHPICDNKLCVEISHLLDLREKNMYFKKLTKRFLSKVGPPFRRCSHLKEPCREWQGSFADEYGKIWCDGKNLIATHVAIYLKTGKWPTQFVLHRCDNTRCVEVSHLFEGTHIDNMYDRNNKKRQAHGESHGMAKLTDVQVRKIFLAAGLQREIAKQFDISQPQVSAIRLGRSRCAALSGLL